ncbi:phosphate ABC transporter ATP-binding protein [Candidatus Desantisbacteria bacterium CG1_02_38_46]|uniref:Phosphate ABC transporter ATP-binding protein n=2 Tax=unclassified Candidatus Desantisiibacteriota TaxID=3106372 RepID=A0A2H9PAB8_9BACT|nr:MAG: phosphate ABC transporter ATP-binding protein [Candidatus Desantisbacteria bacterium CG1_02_38_46]PIZ15305.1 MAG: phosphate ABC transporter ATP-binding protein [Candidatus Desantisbacteria bacterium CG_4_10_14_0_8_um_filter_39_17]
MNTIEVKNLNFYYGNFQALKDIGIAFQEKIITALIGPSGCGKSTLLRCLNRMNDLIEGVKISGEVDFKDKNIYSKNIDVVELRRHVGMVFQRPNPFPLSVFDNVVYGLKVHGVTQAFRLEEIVERSLKATGLWDEMKDKLNSIATELPLEQQQRLCMARLVAIEPEVILMDEPCSALDPIATAKIEELMFELKKKYTIVIVTHNMQQAARVSDCCGFMLLGELIEFGTTSKIFTSPDNQKTQDYITGRFG